MIERAPPPNGFPAIFDAIQWLEWHRRRKRVIYTSPPPYWTIPLDLSAQTCGLSVHNGKPIMLVRENAKLAWFPLVPWEFAIVGKRRAYLLDEDFDRKTVLARAVGGGKANRGRADAGYAPMHGEGIFFVCQDYQVGDWSSPRFGVHIEACESILNLIRNYAILWLGLNHEDGSVSIDGKVNLRTALPPST